MTAHFIDAPDILNWTVRRVQAPNDFIKHGADLFHYALIDFVFRIDRQHAFSGRVENDFAERNAAQLSIFIQQPRNELIDRRFGEPFAPSVRKSPASI